MMNTRYFLSLIISLFVGGLAFGTPTFQVYIDGATAGDYGSDVDTWVTPDHSFDMIVVGGYKNGSIK